LVQARRRELPLHEILRAGRRRFGARSDRALPAHYTAEPVASHEPLDGRPRHRDAVAPPLVPDLPHGVHLVVLREYPLTGLLQARILLDPSGPAGESSCGWQWR
jgi:hypothetical protein